MSSSDSSPSGRQGLLLAPFMGFLSRLRFPYLFALAAFIFGVDLVIPDLIPLADEILFGLVTLMLGSIKKRKEERQTVEAHASPRLEQDRPSN